MAEKEGFELKVPCSSANVGSGFDVLSFSLGLYLKLRVRIDHPDNLIDDLSDIKIDWDPITSEDEGQLKNPRYNLVTLSAAFLASQCKKKLPMMHIDCHVDVPIGCGLGSSGASIIAGVVLANEACKIGLSREEMLQYAIVIEGFGDNVAASMFGGFTICPKPLELTQYMQGAAAYMKDIRKNGAYMEVFKHCPEMKLLKSFDVLNVPLRDDIRLITVTPPCKMDTAQARSLLPRTYPVSDVVSALNNVAKLITCLSSNLPIQKIRHHLSSALKDPIHQPYRATVIPGLSKMLEFDFSSCDNIIGLYLSGAGPSIQVLTYGHDIDSARDLVVEKWTTSAHNEGSTNFPLKCLVSLTSTDGAQCTPLK